jgi:ATP-dependent DNA helicase RecG
LQTRLEVVVRPLRFAAGDGFAHLDRVRDLEASVARACRSVLSGAVPAPVRAQLEKIAESFEAQAQAQAQAEIGAETEAAERAGSGTAAAAREARVDRIRRALAQLEPLLAGDWPARALSSPLSVLPGVGPRRAESLARRGLRDVEQLLFHLPTGYDDRRALVQVGELAVGTRATFIAELQSTGTALSRTRRGRLGRVLEAVVGDATGSVRLKWFHGGDALEQSLRHGALLLVTGDVRRQGFKKQLVHPEVELLGSRGEEVGPELEAGASEAAEVERARLVSRLEGLRRIVPRYATPEGVPPRTLRGLVERAVAEYADLVSGHLPEALVRELDLPGPAEALRLAHAPPFDASLREYEAFASPAQRRLVLEELYLLELGLALRHDEGTRLPGVALDVSSERVEGAAAGLPFRLTAAQARVWREIQRDLARPHPMNRLVQGDVGSGKTAVAFLAAAVAAANGQQAALMAPTEVLAEQHARTLERLAASCAESMRPRVALLSASLPRPEAERIRDQLAAGEVDLVVGTHALVQKEVAFARLALVIVDEQHRFGVLQRQALAGKRDDGLHPHVLVMTATPIPRTLALTLYGDLDCSVIDELPPGRAPVKTLLMREREGAAVARLVGDTVERGEQVYVVYPLVEESEKSDLRSAIESAGRIARAFPASRVDLVHGRLDAPERRSAMRRFESGETRILVSTTVIEVGVDVPQATLMVVEHAERFGLAQLHQLRGRVGRGERPGTCVLVSRARPRSGDAGAPEASDRGEERLKAMLETTDGFEIANADLRIRGPGEFLGTRQSGHLPDLRIADLLRDQRLLAVAREAAFDAVRRDPGLTRSHELRRAVAARWGERLALADVG